MSQNTDDFYYNLTQIVIKAKNDKLSSSQINEILEYSQDTEDKNELFIFIMRQSKKGYYTETAKSMLNYFKNKNMDMTQIRKFIGLLKWLMEALKGIEELSGVEDFDSLLNKFISSSSQDNKQPQGNKNEGGEDEY
ncbi:MAG: hypothetical protein ASUL_08839 [Candidatus Aramenus sulfurataquae]|uniref:Uncharacterized protein n=2 Tax=Candidatus Aramenus sulfurataquae TaxID=1326980 RepID=W7L4P6_9CREN|nr:MAG: hypothetical protein ASUL_08839 [Candidatus Aramenus sulfurataquae]MCL7344493.1 hypothetical protein [Candidatus Aramenus sulfurataquae]